MTKRERIYSKRKKSKIIIFKNGIAFIPNNWYSVISFFENHSRNVANSQRAFYFTEQDGIISESVSSGPPVTITITSKNINK